MSEKRYWIFDEARPGVLFLDASTIEWANLKVAVLGGTLAPAGQGRLFIVDSELGHGREHICTIACAVAK